MRKSTVWTGKPRIQKRYSCTARISYCSGKPWKNCRWNIGRSSSCANSKGYHTKKLRRSPTYRWGRSCHAWPGDARGCSTPWPSVCTRRFEVNCQEAQGLFHAYVDGELDLVRTLDIERHLRECSACTHV